MALLFFREGFIVSTFTLSRKRFFSEFWLICRVFKSKLPFCIDFLAIKSGFATDVDSFKSLWDYSWLTNPFIEPKMPPLAALPAGCADLILLLFRTGLTFPGDSAANLWNFVNPSLLYFYKFYYIKSFVETRKPPVWDIDAYCCNIALDV